MYILGICDSQDSGAVLISDQDQGNNITAVNEERLSRIKLKGGFPSASIKEVLRIRSVKKDEIKQVVVASHMTPAAILRSFSKFHSGLRAKNSQFSFLLSCYISYQIFAKKIKMVERIEAFLSKVIIKLKLKKLGIKSPIITIEHHQAHAYGAYATSGFNEALIFTIDGLGDGVSFTVSIGSQGKVKRILEQDANNDITLYYSRLTEILGFTPIQDEGKVMGLAAYLPDDYQQSECLQPAIVLKTVKGCFKKKNYLLSLFKDRLYYDRMKSSKKEEIAAVFQSHVEKKIIEVISCWVSRTGIKNIVLSGGFFANIKVNQKICQLDIVDDIYVHPHMGDGGLALGAVCAVKKFKPFKVNDIFWGTCFSNDQIRAVLTQEKVNFEFLDKIEGYIAKLLSEGKVIARFNGAMEFGPRALGNRSIITQATDIGIQKNLNNKLKRDEFMPFAPAILEEYKAKCCLLTTKAEYSALFMNVGFQSTDYLKKTCPAVVHKDGSTRPQFVSERSNQSFYKIIEAYRKITQIPVLINTSFNVHEEPIVCTPLEALQSFRKAKLDFLAIGNFLIKGDK